MSPPSDAYFEHERRVMPDDLDDLGHVNNAVYLGYAEACARAHAEAKGLTLDAFRAQGVLPVVRRHVIDYHRPARGGDRLIVSTEVTAFSGPRATRHTEIRLSGEGTLLVSLDTDWVWLDPDSGRPKRVPAEILRAFGF